jgi:hypothetical protein
MRPTGTDELHISQTEFIICTARVLKTLKISEVLQNTEMSIMLLSKFRQPCSQFLVALGHHQASYSIATRGSSGDKAARPSS